MALDKEAFENKCIEVIEKIILLDVEQNRLGAVEVSKSMLEKAKGKYPQSVIAIYERVYEEFCNCTDQEYNILKKQLFSKN